MPTRRSVGHRRGEGNGKGARLRCERRASCAPSISTGSEDHKHQKLLAYLGIGRDIRTLETADRVLQSTGKRVRRPQKERQTKGPLQLAVVPE